MIRYPSSWAFSGSKAPREIDDGFASSPANIERDQGVRYDERSIFSIALRSRSSRRRKATLFAEALMASFYQRRGGEGAAARPLRPGGNPAPAPHGSAPAARAARGRRAECPLPCPRAARDT